MTNYPLTPSANAWNAQALPSAGGAVLPGGALPALYQAHANNVPFGSAGFVLMGLFMFLLLGRPCDFFLSGLRIPMIVSIVTLLVAIASGLLLSSLRTPAATAMLGFTGWLMFCVPFSVWRGGSFEIMQAWWKSFLCFLVLLALVRTVKQTSRMLQIIGLSIFFVGLLSLRFGANLEGRLVLQQGLYSGPNEIATGAIMGMIALGYMAFRPGAGKLIRVFSFGAFLFVGTMLSKSGSRGGTIAVAVVFLVFIWRFSVAVRLVLLMLGLLVGVIGIMALPEEVRIRYVSMFSSDVTAETRQANDQMLNAKASGKERMELLKDSLKVTFLNPIVGVGPGMFGVERHHLMTEGGAARGSFQGTHNTYTQISSEMGLPGFVLFLATLIYSWKNVRRVERLFAPSTDREAKEIQATAFALRLLLLAYIILFCFVYIGYDPFYLVVCALITAFHSAAMRSFQARQQRPDLAPAAGMGMPGMAWAPAMPVPAKSGPSNPSASPSPAAPAPAAGPRYRLGGRMASGRPSF